MVGWLLRLGARRRDGDLPSMSAEAGNTAHGSDCRIHRASQSRARNCQRPHFQVPTCHWQHQRHPGIDMLSLHVSQHLAKPPNSHASSESQHFFLVAVFVVSQLATTLWSSLCSSSPHHAYRTSVLHAEAVIHHGCKHIEIRGPYRNGSGQVHNVGIHQRPERTPRCRMMLMHADAMSRMLWSSSKSTTAASCPESPCGRRNGRMGIPR
jgi:hypothetical protein